MNPLLEGFKAACRPKDRRHPWQWCEDHVVVDATSPMPGKWRATSSPWVKPVLEAFGDNRITDISVMCSAQSSKTQTFLNAACWVIAEDPGPAMWVMAAKDEADTFIRDRARPTFDNCKPVADSFVSYRAREFSFAHMPFYFTGAGSTSKLQSKPIRWLFLDEVRNYPPGALDTVLKRTRAFWNCRRVLVSTPGKENDAVHRAFLAGDQRVFHYRCPSCGGLHPLEFENLKAVHPYTAKPCRFGEVPGARTEAGYWLWENLKPWVRYVCKCGHMFEDTPRDRKYIARNFEFVAQNPNAPKHRASFHWNALLPPWVSWIGIVEEFFTARAAARLGDLSPMFTFRTETQGLPWEDTLGEIDDFDFLEDRRGDYEFGEEWAEANDRMMAADRQESGGEHYPWVIRDYAPGAKSRLVAYGVARTTAELVQTQQDYGVASGNCMIDSGHKASEVYRFCLSTGWKPFKGDDKPFYLHRDPKSKKIVRRVWMKTHVDPFYGVRKRGQAGRVKIPLFLWCNDPVKDLLAEAMKGLVGQWTIAKATPRDYMQQVTAERREAKTDAKGRVTYSWRRVRKDNHWGDCENMLHTAALIKGHLRQSTL